MSCTLFSASVNDRNITYFFVLNSSKIIIAFTEIFHFFCLDIYKVVCCRFVAGLSGGHKLAMSYYCSNVHVGQSEGYAHHMFLLERSMHIEIYLPIFLNLIFFKKRVKNHDFFYLFFLSGWFDHWDGHIKDYEMVVFPPWHIIGNKPRQRHIMSVGINVCCKLHKTPNKYKYIWQTDHSSNPLQLICMESSCREDLTTVKLSLDSHHHFVCKVNSYCINMSIKLWP